MASTRQAIMIEVELDVDYEAVNSLPSISGTVFHNEVDPPLDSIRNLGYSLSPSLVQHINSTLRSIIEPAKYAQLDPQIIVSVRLGNTFEDDQTF